MLDRYYNKLCIKCDNTICKSYGGNCRKYRIVNFLKEILYKIRGVI